MAELLAQRGILWAPDYVVNAGGIVNIYEEFGGYDPVHAEAEVRRIGETTRLVLERARRDGTTPAAAADAIAEERIAAGRRPDGSLFGARRRREEQHASAGLERRGIRAPSPPGARRRRRGSSAPGDLPPPARSSDVARATVAVRATRSSETTKVRRSSPNANAMKTRRGSETS